MADLMCQRRRCTVGNARHAHNAQGTTCLITGAISAASLIQQSLRRWEWGGLRSRVGIGGWDRRERKDGGETMSKGRERTREKGKQSLCGQKPQP